VEGSVELGNSFGMVCTFHLHSLCSFSTAGWHFVSYTTLIEKGAFQTAKLTNAQRIVNVT
jgi:hypothetical protein